MKEGIQIRDEDPLLARLNGFCDALGVYITHKSFELSRDEDLLAGLNILQEKTEGLLEGHHIFIQV